MALPTSREELRAAVDRGEKFSYLCFYGHKPPTDGEVTKSCFSQWFDAPFTVDGVHYPTAEHFMMAEKARLFKDDDMLEEILASPNPATAKALGRSVQNFDESIWRKHRFDIVVRASIAKFDQNPAMKAFLLGTKKHVLVEASPRDTIWGIGYGAKNPKAEEPHNWRGLNLLGFALMIARDALKEKEGE